ncbi:hypothetical protein BSKO_14086 [Bryopsis sp. KO-2023]|nr:hypothetical protein BSKO_14086 [Bryopsis sp. KO-2023]
MFVEDLELLRIRAGLRVPTRSSVTFNDRRQKDGLKVEKLKGTSQKVEEIPSDQQRLIRAGREVEDSKPMFDAGIKPGGALELTPGLSGASTLESNPDWLDPACRKYDRTEVRGTETVVRRGGEIYGRPYGWKDLVLGVLKGLKKDRHTSGNPCARWWWRA